MKSSGGLGWAVKEFCRRGPLMSSTFKARGSELDSWNIARTEEHEIFHEVSTYRFLELSWKNIYKLKMLFEGGLVDIIANIVCWKVCDAQLYDLGPSFTAFCFEVSNLYSSII